MRNPTYHRTNRHGRHARVTLVSLNFAVLAVLISHSGAFAQTVELVNNHPFDIHMPVRVRGLVPQVDIPLVAQAIGPMERPGDTDSVVIASVPAHGTQKIVFGQVRDGLEPLKMDVLQLQPDPAGVSIRRGRRDFGKLAWGVIVAPAPKEKTEGFQAPSTKRDFAASFQPIDLKLREAVSGGILHEWVGSGSAAGLRLDVNLIVYGDGFLDLQTTVTNESAPQKDVYAAVVCRWEQSNTAGRTVCYDNRRSAFDDGAYTPFRAGEGRQQMIQRGVDWINTRFADGAGVTWLNDFSPSFTLHRDASIDSKKNKFGPRWVGANTAQLAQEAQAKGDAIYSITEIARPNIRQYEPRLSDNVLPGADQPLTITYRLAFDRQAVSDDAADNRFVGYAGYNPQELTKGGAKVQFGVPFTRIGTNYFPYSTLGENFGNLRMAGMSKEGYWPLAPQTVLQWQKFADDIRRDLRTLKAMGFELVRLHHLELLYEKDTKSGQYVIPEAKRWEYLDFLFKELENLQLTALLDVKLPASDCAELVKRYGKLVDGVEYDNEILIFQIFDDDISVWKEVHDAVKAVDPKMPFHLTAHTNSGAFDRIAKLGVKFDRVGQHTYMDGLDPIPSSRGYALSMANYGAKHGKEPLITEWNWRFMTRMPMEERAKVYAPIFENVLAARCMSIMYQFQYQDTLAMNPSSLKGIRRYEQLLLSRRPKPEAFEMMKLIERYGPPDSPVRKIGVSHDVVEMTGDAARVEFAIENRTDQPMTLKVRPEAPAEMTASIAGTGEVVLAPKATARVPVSLAFAAGKQRRPGFYHVFLRIEGPDNALRYGWAEVRKGGQPQIDKTINGQVTYAAGALDFNLDRPLTVVYSDEASVLELEAAWTVFITLESATGRPADIYQASDLAKLPDRDKRTIVLVTREKGAKPSVRTEGGDKLVISGGDEKAVTAACMDYVVRYWMTAKDSGARKVGLTAAPAGEGGGKTDLD